MKILITGASGFLGSFVLDRIKNKYSTEIEIYSPRSFEYDLIDYNMVNDMYSKYKPNVVIHLAAEVGGIGANMENPGRFFYANASMGINMVEGARVYGVDKFIFVSTVCGYPKYAKVPFLESEMWDGYPEETNAPYGIAKKGVMVMLRGYYEQYGLKSASLIPTNLYGPKDHFDPKISHVIPALVKKFVDAKDNGEKVVNIWGDGTATREFLYVEDAARGIVEAVDKVDNAEEINLGSGYEINIKDLAEKIKNIVGYEGSIQFEKQKPNGQPRRFLDTSKAKKLLDWEAKMDFDNGLKNTIEWFLNNRI
jgi:nucleoside-diphosphate-sugar epimerase